MRPFPIKFFVKIEPPGCFMFIEVGIVLSLNVIWWKISRLKVKVMKLYLLFFDFSFPISTQNFSVKIFRYDAIIGLLYIFRGD